MWQANQTDLPTEGSSPSILRNPFLFLCDGSSVGKSAGLWHQRSAVQSCPVVPNLFMTLVKN